MATTSAPTADKKTSLSSIFAELRDEIEANPINTDVIKKNEVNMVWERFLVVRNHLEECTHTKTYDINEKDKDGKTILMHACEKGRLDMVILLLANGADVNAKDKTGQTPIFFAYIKKHRAVVEYLLYLKDRDADPKKNVDVNAKDPTSGLTLAMLACKNDHLNILNILLKKNGFDINAEDPTNEQTLLRFACENDLLNIVNILLKKGANVNAENEYKQTLLMLACKNGKLDIVKSLLANGANINAEDKTGKTPIIFAYENNHKEVVEFLLPPEGDVVDPKKAVDVNAKDPISRKTLLMFACNYGHLNIVNILLKKGAKVNEQDSCGQTALMFACNCVEPSATDIVNSLLANGADVNAKDKFKETPLMFACKHGHLDKVELLLTNGADVNAENEFNETPLMFACKYGQFNKVKLSLELDIVNLLLEKGADVNAKDNKGNTPLMIECCKRGTSAEIIKLLLQHGAKIDIKNKDGQTAVELAAFYGNREIAEFLSNEAEACATCRYGGGP